MANRLQRVLAMDEAVKARNAPKAGVQKIVNADGTVTELPYMEDRTGRRTVMTRSGPKVLRGHEGRKSAGTLIGTGLGNIIGGLFGKTSPPYLPPKTDYFDMSGLGPKPKTAITPYETGTGETIYQEQVTDSQGNVTTRFLDMDGSVIADPRDARQPQIAAESVRKQEIADPDFIGPRRPENLDDLRAAERRSTRRKGLFGATPDTFSSKTEVYNDGSFQAVDKAGNITLITKNGRKLTPADPGYSTALAIAVASGRSTSGSGDSSFFSPQAYKDGTRVWANKAGESHILTPEGKKIKPSDLGYAAALEKAVKSGPDYAAQMAYSTGQAETQVKESAAITESIQAAESKQGIYNEMLAAIDAGAESGYLESKLPSITEASVLLDNMQAQLGLNLIQNTTFGALSESELKFALDTATPTNLQPEALRKWVVRKQAAQEKLIDYLYEINAYLLENPGNTKGSYLAMKRRESRKTPTPQNGKEGEVPELGTNNDPLGIR